MADIFDQITAPPARTTAPTQDIFDQVDIFDEVAARPTPLSQSEQVGSVQRGLSAAGLSPDIVGRLTRGREESVSRSLEAAEFETTREFTADPAAFVRARRERALIAGQRAGDIISGRAAQEPLTDIPVAREVLQGLGASALRGQSLVARVLRDDAVADALSRTAAGAQAAGGDSFGSKVLTGTASSIGTLAQAAGLGPAGIIGNFTLQATNDALTQGRDAGLTGPELGRFALGEGMIEGIITTAFSVVGLGGLEKGIRPIVKEGFKQGLKKFGFQSAAEVGEEVVVEFGHRLNQYLHGLSDTAIPSSEDIALIVAQTLLTMGVVEGGSRVLGKVDTETQVPETTEIAERPAEPETSTELEGVLEPETRPERLLPAPGEIEARRLAEAEQELVEAQRGPVAGPEAGPILVSPTGEAVTPAQQAQITATRPRRSLAEVAAQAAQVDPDVKLDPEQAGLTVEFFEGSARETLANADDAFVQVELPLGLLDTNPQYQAEAEAKYANLPPETAPPVFGGVHKNTGRFALIDGNTRARVAQARGAETITAWVPETDARRHGLIAEPFTEAPRREGAEDVAVEQRKADRRTPDLVAEREEIARLFAEGRTEEAASRITAVQERARRDPKGTGLLTGVEFDSQVKAAKQAVDAGGKARHIASFDIANLGLKNTVHGHVEADKTLQRIADVVKRIAGADVSFRTGGDEISVLFPEGMTRREALRMARRIEKEAGREKIIPQASTFIAGEIATITKDRALKDVLAEAEHKSEARKGKKKAQFKEPASFSKEEARKIAEQQAPRLSAARQRLIAARENVALRRGELDAVRAEHAARNRKIRQTLETVHDKVAPLEGTKHRRRTPRSVESWLTPLSSRLYDISTRIYNRLMQMEYDTAVAREQIRGRLTPLARRITQDLGGRGTDKYLKFKKAVLEGRADEAREMLTPEGRVALDEFYSTFRTRLDNMRAAGVTIGDLGETYWPRYIRDFEAFKAMFGKDTGLFEEAWERQRAVVGRKQLTEAEMTEVANQVLQGYGPVKPGKFGIPNARVRTVEEIPAEALSFYGDPFEAAMRYIDASTYAAERTQFLGKNATDENLDDTVGAIVRAEIEAGNLDSAEQQELHDLLTVRFRADLLQPSKAIRTTKQLIYILTLGQFRSVLTQITDIAFTAEAWGLKATAVGLAQAINPRSRRRIMMEQIGIHDHGEEFKDVGKVAQATDYALRATGFKRIDRLGKETRINAARHAMQTHAANPGTAAARKFRDRYEPVLGERRYEGAMRALREGQMTEDVGYLLFLDITQIQPLTTSQMPEQYLRMPNGRILYTLKTFTVMQLDYVRRNMLRKITSAKYRDQKEGWASLAKYLLYFTLIGMGVDMLKDWLRGKSVTADQIPTRTVNGMLGSVGLNRYTVEKAGSDPVDAAFNYLAPPIPLVTAVWQDLFSASGVEEGSRSLRYIPVIGEPLYYWSPVGRGFYLNRDEAKREYRAKLKTLREQAAAVLRDGDTTLARDLVTQYNYLRKQGTGDGRQTPISLGTLRADNARRTRKEAENE